MVKISIGTFIFFLGCFLSMLKVAGLTIVSTWSWAIVLIPFWILGFFYIFAIFFVAAIIVYSKMELGKLKK